MMRRLGALVVVALVACTSEETGTLLLLPAPAASGSDAGELPDCSDARDCPERLPFCNAGRCAECGSDGDCSSGSAPRCSPALGACVECLTSADCSDGDRTICNAGRGSCVECLSDGDCTEPDRPGCLLVEGRCEPCSRDEHCPDGESCSVDEGQCR